MKFSLFILALVATVSLAENGDVTKRFLKCDNILSVKVCDKFRNVATAIKEKAEEVETFVKDAYNKGITKADEVKSYVEKKLEEKILSKSCEELTGKAFCDKLDSISAYMKKKKDELKPYVVKAIMDGKQKAHEIAEQVQDYIKNDLMKKTCDDILPADQCKRIDEIGTALKLKTEEIKQAMIDGVLKGYNKVRDTVTQTFTNMKKAAEKFSCEELLNPDVCASLRNYAQKIRISMPKMMNAVRSAIVMGYKFGKGFINVVYKIADAFIDCEHFLSHENCEKIKSTASKIGARVVEVKNAITEAVKKGITEAEEIYTSTLNFLKSKFGKRKRSLLDRFDFEEKLKQYKEMLKKHLATAEQFIKDAVKAMMEKFKIADAAIKKAVEKAIEEGKVKYEKIKDYIKELIEKKKNGQLISKRDTTDSTGTIGKLRSLLKRAVDKATGITKYIIKKLLDLPMEKLQKIKRTIQDIVDKVLGTETKRDTESELMDMAAENKVTDTFDRLSEQVSNDIDNLADSIVEETHSLIHDVTNGEKNIQKRQLDISLKDFDLANYITEVLRSKLGDIYQKVIDKSSELVKEIKEALSKAGNNMLNVSKVVLEKINKMIEKVKANQDY